MSKYFDQDRVAINANDVDMVFAHDLLNRIEAANVQLRVFLTEKFKLEDVL